MNFDFFYTWAAQDLKLNLYEYKEKQLQRRILTVMNKAGAASLEEYAELIKKDKEIRQFFLDYITINVTEFYRNKEIFDDFEEIVQTRLMTKFPSLKIWSAACSIGAEPYSLALIAENRQLKLQDRILATDIDETILKRAINGIYRKNEMKNVSKMEQEKYFELKNGHYHLKNAIKKKVHFKKHDLLSDPYDTGFHLIVCRNVTIYFKGDSRDRIYQKIRDSLVAGGIFFVGATEVINEPEKNGFKKLTSFLYEKL